MPDFKLLPRFIFEDRYVIDSFNILKMWFCEVKYILVFDIQIKTRYVNGSNKLTFGNVYNFIVKV